MKQLIIIFTIALACKHASAQNKSGYTWIVGNNASFGKFDGTPSSPQTGSVYTINAPNYPYTFYGGHSNICDSATGELLFATDGMRLFDTVGNIIQYGDSLVPTKIYTHNASPGIPETQGSLIIPKGNNGEYYLFNTTISDSMYNYWFANQQLGKFPYDLLQYHVVDMNAIGGLGSVVVKNKKLLHDVELNKIGMQACRHANGIDWWLLKQGGYDKNEIYKFYVTKDSIYPPIIQTFTEPKFGFYDLTGQMAFSKDGKKFASVQGKSNKLFIADFDRCSGELSNPKLFNIPIDSTTSPFYDNMGSLDSISLGACFSPNGQFLYISKAWNIYQFEFSLNDSSLAWVRVQHGPDTSLQKFQNYKHLYVGPNGRIYIGNWGGTAKQFSVIDYPNNKGLACGFCRKCFRVDSALGGITAPPNMPDYTLGADLSKVCWPLGGNEIIETSEKLEIFPNPTSTLINIKSSSNSKRELYNFIGQLLFTTKANEINVIKYSKGIYYIKVENSVKKVIIE